jgi:RimJ/RimL family protein N-acetyltransferase
MSEWVMSEMGFRRLEALADVGNIASHRVLEKAGFTREATLKKRNTRPDGNQIDMALYSKVDS